jgi:hypothetical protein
VNGIMRLLSQLSRSRTWSPRDERSPELSPQQESRA